MTKLIKLTTPPGAPIWINPDQVVSIRAIPEIERADLESVMRKHGGSGFTEITLFRGVQHVTERIDDVLEALNG